jgi:hypothetical protein
MDEYQKMKKLNEFPESRCVYYIRYLRFYFDIPFP